MQFVLVGIVCGSVLVSFTPILMSYSSLFIWLLKCQSSMPEEYVSNDPTLLYYQPHKNAWLTKVIVGLCKCFGYPYCFLFVAMLLTFYIVDYAQSVRDDVI